VIRAVIANEAVSCDTLCGVDKTVVIVDVDERPTDELMVTQFTECFSDGHDGSTLEVRTEAVDDGTVHG
jgi:hypothetical protein